MPIISTLPTQVPTGLVHDTDVTATTLPVSTVAGSNFKTLLRVVTPAEPGDILDITGRARVTCELAYTCGVGYYLWAYDADDGVPYANKVWTQIGPYNGDNVWESTTANRHHMPLHISDVYQVPSTWPAGHRMTVVFRADAHSTKAIAGQSLDVDGDYGSLTVRRWATV
jgi:hypothetical protein